MLHSNAYLIVLVGYDGLEVVARDTDRPLTFVDEDVT